jgi:pectate lyase
MKIRVFLGAIFLMSSPVAVQALPAFYGAEGGGALSVGGRGGVVCQVTNLDNDSGPGSLRACVDMSGPRTVVFRVGGTINLTSTLMITNPYITIAGHTAPGGGIQLNGKSITSGHMLRVNTHDVVIRYLKIRKGRTTGTGTVPNAAAITSLGASGDARRPERIVLDHLSLFWGLDENLAVWGGRDSHEDIPNHISIQNSIIAEGLRGHGAGHITGAGSEKSAHLMKNIDVHKNLFAFNAYRSPLVRTSDTRVINNISYHWSIYAAEASTGNYDFIGNLYKHPNPTGIRTERRYEIQVYRTDPDSCPSPAFGVPGDPSIHAVGNSGPWHPDPSNNWNLVARTNCSHGFYQEPLPAQYRRSSPLPPAGIPITVMPVSDLESYLLPIVGASRRLDCMGNWVASRDAADSRVVNHVINNYNPAWSPYNSLKSYGPEDETEVGGFPTIAGGTPCADTDGDGMPDEWEIARGLNPNNAADRNTVHSSGYTMLEMYLNGPMTTNTTITTPANVRFVQ